MAVHTTRQGFFDAYELRLTKEFNLDGNDARWAPSRSGPRFWGEEDAAIDFENDRLLSRNDGSYSAMAVSPDGQLVAVAVSSTIRIYEVHTRQLLGELKGHPHGVSKLAFAPTSDAMGTKDGKSRYTLLSACSGRSSKDKFVIPWQLDGKGRQVFETGFEPFEINVLADDALAMISDSLQGREITPYELGAIRSSMTQSLDVVEKQHRLRLLPSVKGSLPIRNTTDLFNIDGETIRVLYLAKNEHTQHGMRPVEELPQVVVASIAPAHNNGMPYLQTQHKLQGHTDMITSVAFSPNGKFVVSASYDQTFRIWSAETGECLHIIGPTGGQNTRVAFSTSGERVCLGGGYKPNPLFSLCSTSTGEQVGRLDWSDGFTRKCELAVCPDGKYTAVRNGISVLLWNTAASENNDNGDEESQDKSGKEILRLAEPADEPPNKLRTFRAMGSLLDVAWVDEGKKLLVRGSDSTVFVWDRERNIKWRFQRRHTTDFINYSPKFAYVKSGEHGMLISFDVDGKLRFWTL